jgi:hypothetical protein
MKVEASRKKEKSFKLPVGLVQTIHGSFGLPEGLLQWTRGVLRDSLVGLF